MRKKENWQIWCAGSKRRIGQYLIFKICFWNAHCVMRCIEFWNIVLKYGGEVVSRGCAHKQNYQANGGVRLAFETSAFLAMMIWKTYCNVQHPTIFFQSMKHILRIFSTQIIWQYMGHFLWFWELIRNVSISEYLGHISIMVKGMYLGEANIQPLDHSSRHRLT